MVPLRISMLGTVIPPPLAARPSVLVLAISVVIGFLTLLVFRYTSSQKAIRRAKDRLKAHLLAVRLFRDQLSVVLSSYAQILLDTGNYLRHAFRPFLIVILPVFFLVVHLDRYLGWVPIQPRQPFLIEVQTDQDEPLGGIQLQLPPGLVSTAPAMHIPKGNQVVWRLEAARAGEYNIDVIADGHKSSKQVVVSYGLSSISPVRLRGNFWQRMLSSGEAALSRDDRIQSISINYSPREIAFAGWQWNWIVLFFVFSLTAGFIFKILFRIQI